MTNSKTMKVKELKNKVRKSTNLTKPMKQFALKASNSLLEEIIYNANVQKPYFDMSVKANSPSLKHDVCKEFYNTMTKQFSQIYGGLSAGQCATALVAIAMNNDLSDYFKNHVSHISIEVKK
jgi:hypothetical protein